MSKFLLLFKVILVLPPVRLSILVQIDSADTEIASQDSVKKVLELTEKWKYLDFRGKF